jgi:transposase
MKTDMKIKNNSQLNQASKEDLIALIAQLKLDKLQLQNRLCLMQLMLFSSRRERFTPDPEGIKPLFDEVEQEAKSFENSEEQESEASNKSDPKSPSIKNRGKRKPLPDYIPRERRECDLADHEKKCSKHNLDLIKIGEEVTEKLELIPAQVKVIEQVVLRYKCPSCFDEGGIVKVAEKSVDPIPKSFATPSLLAHIAVSKYDDALPLNRQEKIYERHGIDLDRTTMARWMIKCADLARPLYNLMHEELLATPVIHADETGLQVLNEENRKPEQKSYMWTLARQGIFAPIILFMYFNNRSAKSAVALLQDFKGTLVCDAYKAYASAARSLSFKLAGCMSHCRRKFWEAEKAANAQRIKLERVLASEAMRLIRELYKIERSIKGKPPDEILAARQKESLPIMQKLELWLATKILVVTPSSPTGKAIAYALNNWNELSVFLSNGMVPIDNNYMEAHIRPFVIGRNNWLFAASEAGAESSAILYSLVQTAKANSIDPFDYLCLIFKELPNAQTLDSLEKLLPYQASKFFSLKQLTQPA